MKNYLSVLVLLISFFTLSVSPGTSSGDEKEKEGKKSQINVNNASEGKGKEKANDENFQPPAGNGSPKIGNGNSPSTFNISTLVRQNNGRESCAGESSKGESSKGEPFEEFAFQGNIYCGPNPQSLPKNVTHHIQILQTIELSKYIQHLPDADLTSSVLPPSHTIAHATSNTLCMPFQRVLKCCSNNKKLYKLKAGRFDNAESDDEEAEFLRHDDEESHSQNHRNGPSNPSFEWTSNIPLLAKAIDDSLVERETNNKALRAFKYTGSALAVIAGVTAAQGLCGLIMHYTKGTIVDAEKTFNKVYDGSFDIFESGSIASIFMTIYLDVNLSAVISKQFAERWDIIFRALCGKTRFKAVTHEGVTQDLILRRTTWSNILKGIVGVSGACTALIAGMEFLEIEKNHHPFFAITVGPLCAQLVESFYSMGARTIEHSLFKAQYSGTDLTRKKLKDYLDNSRQIISSNKKYTDTLYRKMIAEKHTHYDLDNLNHRDMLFFASTLFVVPKWGEDRGYPEAEGGVKSSTYQDNHLAPEFRKPI
jgi:hypothetical protein